MHQSSYLLMEDFRDRYIQNLNSYPISILDIGSLNVNGSYQPLFNDDRYQYTGVDQAPGPNVDIVLKKPYFWEEIKSSSHDVVISGQTFEHAEYFWLSMLEITRVLKPGGLCCIIAPSEGHIHNFPMDCYRFLPNGLRAAAKFAGLETLEAETKQWQQNIFNDTSAEWKDTRLIARKKGTQRFYRKVKKKLFYFSIKWLGDYR